MACLCGRWLGIPKSEIVRRPFQFPIGLLFVDVWCFIPITTNGKLNGTQFELYSDLYFSPSISATFLLMSSAINCFTVSNAAETENVNNLLARWPDGLNKYYCEESCAGF
jgi:hypothetical protein